MKDSHLLLAAASFLSGIYAAMKEAMLVVIDLDCEDIANMGFLFGIALIFLIPFGLAAAFFLCMWFRLF